MKKRRIFSLFLVLIMVCALAAGCGGKDEDAGDQEDPKKQRHQRKMTRRRISGKMRQRSSQQSQKLLKKIGGISLGIFSNFQSMPICIKRCLTLLMKDICRKKTNKCI